jgi:hypothetical protein
VTVLDCDLTAETTQSFNTDTTFTFCGLTWTKFNSANEVTHAHITNGTGLIFTPTSATDVNATNRTAPLLDTPLDGIVPGLAPDTALRIMGFESADNAAASFDGDIVMVENILSLQQNNNFRIKRGFTDTQKGFVAGVDNFGNGSATIFNPDANVEIQDRATMIFLPAGVVGGRGTFSAGVFDAGWPALDKLDTIASSNWNGNTVTNTGGPLGQPAQWQLSLGANRANSATALVVTFARVRVDYHP